MAKLDFSNSKFAQEMQENIQDKFKGFRFQTTGEFDVTARLLKQFCEQKNKEASPFSKISDPTINEALLADINDIVDILNDCDSYISKEYIKNYPAKFIKIDFDAIDNDQQEEKKLAILSSLEEETDKDIEQSFQKLVFAEIADQADYFIKTEENTRLTRIQERLAKTKQGQETQKVLSKALPPEPGSERSTVTDELAKIFGGTHRYQEVIEKLSEIPAVSNCADIQGHIDANYVDTSGIKWSFTIQAKPQTTSQLVIVISNDQSITPNPENPEGIVTAGQAVCVFLYPNFNYAAGEHSVSTSTICDLLHTTVLRKIDISFAYAHALAAHKTELFESLLPEFLATSLSREKMVEKINSMQAPAFDQLPLLAIFRGLINPNHNALDSQDEQDDLSDEEGNDVLNFQRRHLNNLRGFLQNFMRNTNPHNGFSDSDSDLDEASDVELQNEDDVELEPAVQAQQATRPYSRENPRRSTRIRRAPNRL